MDQAALIRASLNKTWEEVRPQMELALLEQLSTGKAARQTDISDMSQAARWLDQAENDQQWRMALIEAAGKFSERAALFMIENGRLLCAALHGATSDTLPGLPIPIEEAPAFRTAIETGEPVVALRRAAEISEPIALVFNASGINKAFLIPMRAGGKTAAVLYAEGVDVRLPALELLMRIASGSVRPISDFWRNLSTAEKQMHLKAQRFARVSVAGMILSRPLDVRAGRKRRAIYSAFHGEIDRLRNQFADEFFLKSRNMVDYLHVELLSKLANDDATLLGAEYPGQMH